MRIDCGIHPWEVTRYTIAELEALSDALKERERAAREAGE
jgi:hypothetical protein